MICDAYFCLFNTRKCDTSIFVKRLFENKQCCKKQRSRRWKCTQFIRVEGWNWEIMFVGNVDVM